MGSGCDQGLKPDLTSLKDKPLADIIIKYITSSLALAHVFTS